MPTTNSNTTSGMWPGVFQTAPSSALAAQIASNTTVVLPDITKSLAVCSALSFGNTTNTWLAPHPSGSYLKIASQAVQICSVGVVERESGSGTGTTSQPFGNIR